MSVDSLSAKQHIPRSHSHRPWQDLQGSDSGKSIPTTSGSRSSGSIAREAELREQLAAQERQLSAMRRISSGGSSGSMSKSSNGGLSLDKARQLSATQPLSGRNGGGGRSFRALAAMSAVADLGALPSPAVVNDVLAAAARAARTAPLFHVVWRLNLKPHTS